MRKPTIKVRVTPESYEGLVEQGFELSDGDDQAERQLYAKFANQAIMDKLTKTQRRVVIRLSEGKKRVEISSNSITSLQEVHQIVARIKRRVEERELPKEHMKTIENLVYWLAYYRCCGAKKIYDGWFGDPITNDYPRPSIITLRKWIKSYKPE